MKYDKLTKILWTFVNLGMLYVCCEIVAFVMEYYSPPVKIWMLIPFLVLLIYIYYYWFNTKKLFIIMVYIQYSLFIVSQVLRYFIPR